MCVWQHSDFKMSDFRMYFLWVHFGDDNTTWDHFSPVNFPVKFFRNPPDEVPSTFKSSRMFGSTSSYSPFFKSSYSSCLYFSCKGKSSISLAVIQQKFSSKPHFPINILLIATILKITQVKGVLWSDLVKNHEDWLLLNIFLFVQLFRQDFLS